MLDLVDNVFSCTSLRLCCGPHQIQ